MLKEVELKLTTRAYKNVKDSGIERGYTEDYEIEQILNNSVVLVNNIREVGIKKLNNRENKFTVNELCMFADILNATIIDYNIDPRDHLKMDIVGVAEYSPDTFLKWNTTIKEMKEKVFSLTLEEATAIVLNSNKFWSLDIDERNNFVEVIEKLYKMTA